MQMTLAYQGRSRVDSGPGGLAVALAPNLRRDRVAFEGRLRDPVRFREAIGALHDVVINDLRVVPRDRSAHEAYRREQAQVEAAIRQTIAGQARQAQIEAMPELPESFSVDFEKRHNRLRQTYWGARQRYARSLWQSDPELWRLLMPCDPIITVAPDALLFECFSADESSYGCLTVDREAFAAEGPVALGTTNVDYSWALSERFQLLRSYRETRFSIDPTGFEVRTGEAAAGYREEKIDLPPSWLRALLNLQAAQSLPMRRVALPREALYAILAHLRRHRAPRSPRALRFELVPGGESRVVLEPWERVVPIRGVDLEDGPAETIRVWGRDRLLTLARLLPLVESAEVFLLGTGLPSFWSLRLGPMRLLLGLSGWTANDWSGGSALEGLAPPADPSTSLLERLATAFHDDPSRTFEQLRLATGAPAAEVAAGLNRLAGHGQVVHDLVVGLYRWRQVLPVAVAADQLGPESTETVAGRELLAAGRVQITTGPEPLESGLRVVEGTVGERPVRLVLDGDGRIVRGKCTCSHHFRFGIRRGPCRHLLALRDATRSAARPSGLEAWFDGLEGAALGR